MSKLLFGMIGALVLLLGITFFVTKNVSNAPAPVASDTPDMMVLPAYKDLIKVTSLQMGGVVTSPLEIRGEARGNWFFEASFPVRLLDANGAELAVTFAQAEGEWMTTEFVPFSSTVTFSAPSTQTGTLVLEKDNASGLPEFDDSFTIPVRFVP